MATITEWKQKVNRQEQGLPLLEVEVDGLFHGAWGEPKIKQQLRANREEWQK